MRPLIGSRAGTAELAIGNSANPGHPTGSPQNGGLWTRPPLPAKVIGVGRRLALVNPAWKVQLAVQNRLSRKLRVAFGPIVTGERTLGTRKFHIDPIVRFINRHSDEYVCDVFLDRSPPERLLGYDIVVIVKHFDIASPGLLRSFRARGIRLVYSIVDNPAGCLRSYLDEPWFLASIDGLILSSPLQADELDSVDPIRSAIPPPVIGQRHKEAYAARGPVRVVWEGMVENLGFMERVNPIVHQVARDSRKQLELIYYSNVPRRADRGVQYVPWKLSRWEQRLVGADVAIVIKPPEDPIQRRKPPTKVQNYMAAGLPVVCTPSEADRLVVEDGRTGFFAHSEDEWYHRLRALVEDAGLRERVGRAARESVLATANLERVAALHVNLFGAVLARPLRLSESARTANL